MRKGILFLVFTILNLAATLTQSTVTAQTTAAPSQSTVTAQITATTQSAQTSGNPIFPGWYADPEVAIFDNTYWVYPTYSDKYNKQVFFDAFSSPDLIHWAKHPHILDTTSIRWAHRAMWAPAITKKAGKYYFFFAANDIQNDFTIGGIGVAVADKPEGPYKDYLKHPLIDKFHNGAQPIDMAVFQDKDGQYYMIYGGWRHCNITKLKADFTGFEPFPDGTTFKEITPKGYVEGPWMFLRNGKYYFMWSEGGWTGPDYSVAYAIADAPTGPFTRIGKILQQDTAVATGAGHHSVIHIPDTDDYYIVYHRHPLGDADGNHRVTCIDHMSFYSDGRIRPVTITKEGVTPRPLR
jgi:beta-xylosidase